MGQKVISGDLNVTGAIKHNGRWYTFDIAFDVTGSNWAGTNSIRMANEW